MSVKASIVVLRGGSVYKKNFNGVFMGESSLLSKVSIMDRLRLLLKVGGDLSLQLTSLSSTSFNRSSILLTLIQSSCVASKTGQC